MWEAGHQFALGFGQIERGPIDAGRGAGEVDPKDDERERYGCDTNQLVNQPCCNWPIVTRSIVPAISTGTTSHMPSGTS